MRSRTTEKIAEYVNEAGGRTYYVGGCVRDRLLGTDSKDVDIEVHGIEPDSLYAILRQVGNPVTFGKSFGVYALRGEDIDIAMPRREHAVGRGHRDFEVDVDPYIGTEKASGRRDFTINAIMQDVLTGEFIDHFGGQKDLEQGIIRHIDAKTFVEDPLRVLRAAQFAARFGFVISDETVELCRSIDISTLSKERVEEELKKALLKAERPSVFFESLRSMDQLGCWFSETEQLIGIEQDPIYHPEGDVWVHTMEVIDRAAAYRDKVSDPFCFMLLALTHDFGKVLTTERSEKDGRIHSYGHETEGLPLAESFVKRITNEKSVISYVKNMVPLHMKPNVAAYSKPSLKSTNKMYDAATAPADLIYFALCDRPLFAGNEKFDRDYAFLFERLQKYNEIMARPYVTGRDLIDAGLKPGEDFSEILEYAHKLRLAGIDRESAMKQVLAYAGKVLRHNKD